MKKTLIALVVLSFILMASAVVGAEGNKIIGSDHKYIAGIDFPNFGWSTFNDDGLLTGYKGFNVGIGYSQKTYFNPGLVEKQFNTYWGWGTVAVIFPYIEVGADYPFIVNEDGSFWTAGGSVGLITIAPSARFSVAFHF